MLDPAAVDGWLFVASGPSVSSLPSLLLLAASLLAVTHQEVTWDDNCAAGTDHMKLNSSGERNERTVRCIGVSQDRPQAKHASRFSTAPSCQRRAPSASLPLPPRQAPSLSTAVALRRALRRHTSARRVPRAAAPEARTSGRNQPDLSSPRGAPRSLASTGAAVLEPPRSTVHGPATLAGMPIPCTAKLLHSLETENINIYTTLWNPFGNRE